MPIISNVKYTNSLLCFVDILGFKDLVCSKSQEHIVAYALEILYDSLFSPSIGEEIDIALSENEPIDSNIGEQISNGLRKINAQFQGNISYFSDHVVISFPIDKDNLKNIDKLMTLLCKLERLISAFYDSFWDDIGIRGAIVIGEVYHSEQIVFGPAMVEAYLLESSKAQIPRIIFSTEATEVRWIKIAIRLFRKRATSIDISKLDDIHVSMSIFKISPKHLKRAFADPKHKLLDFCPNKDNIKKGNFLAAKLWKYRNYVERSCSRIQAPSLFQRLNRDIRKRYQKERTKLDRILALYQDQLDKLVELSKNNCKKTESTFRANSKIDKNKHKIHSNDRNGTRILMGDSVHIYPTSKSQTPQYHGNCCKGIVLSIEKNGDVKVKMNASIQAGCNCIHAQKNNVLSPDFIQKKIKH